ncbi:MAG: sigma-70 family RNA polymerase sigma factor [Deltaproteobacteria bacterium]|nr:sigma-70 family RNA polymerase sigma factor [Deltaproteobacteria bacterium]
MHDEDVRLMLAFRGGNDAAFEALFERWAGKLLRFLERMVRDTAVAEELVQETFLRVHRARSRYEPDAKFSTWLYTIASNVARNELRRPFRRAPHDSTDAEREGAPLELAAEESPVDEIVNARREGSEVEAALQKLPERQRAALWLAAVEGLPYAEVAQALETSESSVKALVHRARVALAEQLASAREKLTEAPKPVALRGVTR